MSRTCSTCIPRDRERALSAYVERRMKQLVSEAESEMRSLEGRMSGDDSGLADIFEEWADQLCGEHTVFFDLYEEMAHDICDSLVSKLSPFEIEMLAAFTEQFLDFWSGNDFEKGCPWENFHAQDGLTEALATAFEKHAIDWYEARQDEDDDDVYDEDEDEDECDEVA